MNKNALGFVALMMTSAAIAAVKPNIVMIYCDDLGYGDVQCLNKERGKIETPNIDKLAGEGMIFTDAHTSSSVCTPSRYGLMTGRYNWRGKRQTGVTGGYSKALIPTTRTTIASLLKGQGYNTGMIGKWHLGMNYTAGKGMRNINWQGEIKGGPSDLGFDYYFGITASLDMPPYIYIENNKFVGECTTTKAFYRKGPAEKDFEAVNVLPDLARKTIEYISQQKAGTPFFAYVALTSPHTPIAVAPEWKGKSAIGNYGDFVMQTDAVIGEVVRAVDDAGLADNTVIIVSSDNGCSKAADIKGMQKKGHFPSAEYRGSKADIWDGGHRVPFIVRWPKGVKAGSICGQTICVTDVMATAAELSGAAMPENAGEDSVSFVPALSGKKIVSTRSGVIHHSISGHFAYRMGKWKLVLAKGSGGWTAPKEAEATKKGAPIAQLYDMEKDPSETTNLYLTQPEVAARLLKQMESDVARGRSTDGSAAANDAPKINLWKSGK